MCVHVCVCVRVCSAHPINLQIVCSKTTFDLCTHNSDFSIYNYFSISVQFFFPKWPLIFGAIAIQIVFSKTNLDFWQRSDVCARVRVCACVCVCV